MRLREINLGCFGGGTGLPSLLGGLKRNPWLRLPSASILATPDFCAGQAK